jgi:hypothetical protein
MVVGPGLLLLPLELAASSIGYRPWQLLLLLLSNLQVLWLATLLLLLLARLW